MRCLSDEPCRIRDPLLPLAAVICELLLMEKALIERWANDMDADESEVPSRVECSFLDAFQCRKVVIPSWRRVKVE